MEITQERMEREFGVEVVATAPHVVYHVLSKSGEILEVRSPRDFPPPLGDRRDGRALCRDEHNRSGGILRRGDGSLSIPARDF